MKLVTVINLTLPFAPSTNTYYRTVNGRMLISEKGRKYRHAVQFCVMDQLRKLPRLTCRVSVAITAYPPDKRRRDLDNMLKAVLDSLTHAGVWADDSQIDSLRIDRAHVGGMLKIEIQEMQS